MGNGNDNQGCKYKKNLMVVEGKVVYHLSYPILMVVYVSVGVIMYMDTAAISVCMIRMISIGVVSAS